MRNGLWLCCQCVKLQVNDAVSNHLSAPLCLGQEQEAQRLGVCYGALVVAGVALQHRCRRYLAKRSTVTQSMGMPCKGVRGNAMAEMPCRTGMIMKDPG